MKRIAKSLLLVLVIFLMVCRGDSVYLDISEDKEHTVVLKAAESTGNVAEADYLVRIHSIYVASVER